MKKIIAGIVIALALFAGGSHLYEAAYCKGVAQGALDGLSMVFGLPPEEEGARLVGDIVASCSANPNGRWNDRMSALLPEYTIGNPFDKFVLDPIKSLFGK